MWLAKCDNPMSNIWNLWLAGKLVIETDPSLYFFINQGCLHVDNMDDVEEMKATDVGGPPEVPPQILDNS